MLVGYEDYRLVLEKRAADYVMIDPTWVGGISQSRRVADLAQFYNVPVVMHDCTGPFTLLSGIQVGIAASNVAWQETLRAHGRAAEGAVVGVHGRHAERVQEVCEALGGAIPVVADFSDPDWKAMRVKIKANRGINPTLSRMEIVRNIKHDKTALHQRQRVGCKPRSAAQSVRETRRATSVCLAGPRA